MEIITDGKLVIKAQYLCFMQESTNWFLYQHPQQQVITVIAHRILHPQLDVTAIIDIYDVPKVYVTGQKQNISYQDILYV